MLVVSELTPAQAAAARPRPRARDRDARAAPPTAHAAILARALGIPAAVGLGPRVLAIAEGTQVLLDGDDGTVLVAPSEEALDARAPRASGRLSAGSRPAGTRASPR